MRMHLYLYLYLYRYPYLHLHLYIYPPGGRRARGIGAEGRVCGPQVQVRHLATLEPERSLRRPGAPVHCLATVGREVWGGVGKSAVAWGRL
jgi:hypothetical protein